ncbi:oxidoreductase-like protein [Limtongia smithiae]|uniref:oxidoreductase-like protein n=1 Tax=Limtongia smithiae TaxID=1125753 RepID=UPI0034CE1EEF
MSANIRIRPSVVEKAVVRSNGRTFHTSAVRQFTPYKFYDLAKQQIVNPEANSDSHKPKFTAAAAKPAFAEEQSVLERARKVFGQRLSGQARRDALAAQERDILGIKVPPRPAEPDNCCTSGCVNCVWELFRQDVEHWQTRRKQAIQAIVAQNRYDLWQDDWGPNPAEKLKAEGKDLKEVPKEKIEGELKNDDDMFKDANIGIRVFIETQRKIERRKQLREQQARTHPAPGAVPPPPIPPNPPFASL